MTWLRSFTFHLCFYIGTFVLLIALLPFTAMRRPLFVPQIFTSYAGWLLRHVAGLTFQIEGKENIPKDHPFLIVSNHQSAWETLMFFQIFNNPVMILKKELLRIPMFGWFLSRTGMLALDRKSPATSFRTLIKDINTRLNHEKRPICIFPEGTRKPPGLTGKFQRGVFLIQKQLRAEILCVAHNAGVFWKPHNFIIRPGVVKVFIYPLLPNVLEGELLEEVLPRMIHTKANELSKEGYYHE